MAKIEAGNNQFFLINGIPKQRGEYEIVTDVAGGVELVGIRMVGRDGWVEGCQLKPVTAYTDSTNTPIPTLNAFFSYVTPFFFREASSGGGGGGGGGGGSGGGSNSFKELQVSFNDYLGYTGNGGGIGFLSGGAAAFGISVPNPVNATGVWAVPVSNVSIHTTTIASSQILFGNLTDKANHFIFKRRMRMTSFQNNRSFHHGYVHYSMLSNASSILYAGIFFRWQTNGTTVVNFQAHVRNEGISTTVTPSYQPPNWNDWFVLEFRIGSSGIQFFVDDVAVTPFITTNMPVMDSNFYYRFIVWSQLANSNVCEIDWDYIRPNNI
jgi:hypothetical protein